MMANESQGPLYATHQVCTKPGVLDIIYFLFSSILHLLFQPLGTISYTVEMHVQKTWQWKVLFNDNNNKFKELTGVWRGGGEGVEEEKKFWLPLVFHGCFLHEERQRVISRKIFFAHQLLQIQLFLHAYSNSESKSYLRNAGSIAIKRHNSN